MVEGEVSEEDLARIPRLASDCDPTSLTLSPSEGFLLSRIDGQTSWKLLREIGGLTSDEVDICLEDWLLRGVIDIDGRPPRVKRRKRSEEESRGGGSKFRKRPRKFDEGLVDPDLDLDPEIQREILKAEKRLDLDYFGVLEVTRDADDKQIRRAYFDLSKRFHPDRYFRREIGDYAKRLERIFKQITEAYELLADPESRKQVEKTLAIHEARALPTPAACSSGGGSAAEQAAPLSPIERLRQRMPFRVPEEVRKAKSEKGEELFKTARTSLKMGRIAEAASNMRLAVAFDPFNTEYKQFFGEVQAKLALDRIQALLGASAGGIDANDRREAERLCEEVMVFRPDDPEVNDLAARLFLAISDTDRAEKCARKAVETCPEVAQHRRTLASVLRSKGLKGHALKELEKALELDSGDSEARKMIQELRASPNRNVASGGMG